MAIGPGYRRSSRDRRTLDVVIGIGGFEFEAESGRHFVTGGNVETRIVFERNMTTGRRYFIIEVGQFAPTRAQAEIPAVCCCCGRCEGHKRYAREGDGSEFH